MHAISNAKQQRNPSGVVSDDELRAGESPLLHAPGERVPLGPEQETPRQVDERGPVQLEEAVSI